MKTQFKITLTREELLGMIRASTEDVRIPEDAKITVEADGGWLKAIVDEHNPIEITWSK